MRLRRSHMCSLLAVCAALIVSKNVVLAVDDEVIPGEYLVLLKDDAPVSSLGHVLDGVDVMAEQKMGKQTFLHLKMGEEKIQMFISHPSVDVFEHNRMVTVSDPVNSDVKVEDYATEMDTKNDSKEHKQDHVETSRDQCVEQPTNGQNRIYGLVRTSRRSLPNYPRDPYVYGLTGAGVDMYVIDSGIELAHLDFGGRASNGFVASQHQSEGYEDLHGHGTNVASLAGGFGYGIAKGVNLINVKVLGRDNRGSWSSIASGVTYVANRVRDERRRGKKVRAVINMSIYGTSFSQTLYNAIANAISERVIVLVCAGNDGVSAERQYPAGFDNTLTVGAIDINDNFASFSNWGRYVDISAAGVRTYAAWSSSSSRCSGVPTYQCVVSASGTSMATPIVAGVVARYLESVPDSQLGSINQGTIRSMLVQTASTGFIRFGNTNQRTTPNRLVYRDCAFDVNHVNPLSDKEQMPEEANQAGASKQEPVNRRRPRKPKKNPLTKS